MDSVRDYFDHLYTVYKFIYIYIYIYISTVQPKTLLRVHRTKQVGPFKYIQFIFV
jgi:hypothetical protein